MRELVRSNVVEIHEGWETEIAGTRVTAGMVDHGIVRLLCFAFRFDGESGKSAVFMGDTVPCDALIDESEPTQT